MAGFRHNNRVHLLDEKSDTHFVFLSLDLMEIVLSNPEYKKRVLSTLENGRAALETKLTKARNTFFNQQDMASWLSQIKEEASLETGKIYIRSEATFGKKETSIDFEKLGYLSGLYDAADQYLNQIAAGFSFAEDQSHYSILDRLDHLDELYLKTDRLPSYYRVQADEKIRKHVFEIKNLDNYWKEHLDLSNRYDVAEGFGDKKFLLQLYHNEFCLQLVQLRPRSDAKSMLDFHCAAYAGELNDFLNHIEFRILSSLQHFSGNEYPVYVGMIKEWLKDKKHQLSKADEKFLWEALVSSCAAFLDSLAIHKMVNDENKYNTIITLLLRQGIRHKGWFANDQSLGGFTNSKSKAPRAGIAERDLLIINEQQQVFSAVEFLRLKYVPRTTYTQSDLRTHLEKIFYNEINGVSPLFIIVFCETASFAKTWEKYLDYIRKMDFGRYRLIKLETNPPIKPERANLINAVSTHQREGMEISLYHLFINMKP